MVEATGCDLGEVLFVDEPAVTDGARFCPHPKRLWRSAITFGSVDGVVRVAGKHVVGDRYPVARDEQSDHDLGTILAVITGKAERLRRKPWRAPHIAFEVRRGDVVTAEAKVQVRKVGEQLGNSNASRSRPCCRR